MKFFDLFFKKFRLCLTLSLLILYLFHQFHYIVCDNDEKTTLSNGKKGANCSNSKCHTKIPNVKYRQGNSDQVFQSQLKILAISKASGSVYFHEKCLLFEIWLKTGSASIISVPSLDTDWIRFIYLTNL